MTQNLVIGLNSGTSFDGIDTVLVKFKKGSLKPVFVDGLIYEYPKSIKEKIRTLITDTRTCPRISLLQTISQLNFLLGEMFATAVLKIIKRNNLNSKDILLVASHGQTIYHHPKIENIARHKIRSTFQLGESTVIAQRTRIKTISNFREGDIACGGQGAPLMPFLDWVIFNKEQEVVTILNLGGIANITVCGKNTIPIAFDIGPANALIDLISTKYFKKDFDKDGKLARKGKVHCNLIEQALRDLYFKKKPPKSTGKEYFNFNFIQKYFATIKRKEDKLATVTFLTAKTIEKAFKNFIFPRFKVNKIVISGGGIKNKTLINHLRELLPGLQLVSSDKYGFPTQYKEAILFALLGYTCHLKKPNNMPSCTGAKRRVILGKITEVM